MGSRLSDASGFDAMFFVSTNMPGPTPSALATWGASDVIAAAAPVHQPLLVTAGLRAAAVSAAVQRRVRRIVEGVSEAVRADDSVLALQLQILDARVQI